MKLNQFSFSIFFLFSFLLLSCSDSHRIGPGGKNPDAVAPDKPAPEDAAALPPDGPPFSEGGGAVDEGALPDGETGASHVPDARAPDAPAPAIGLNAIAPQEPMA